MSREEDTQNAKDQAQAQFESIKEMIEALNNARDEDGDTCGGPWEEAQQTIQEDPLAVEVRSCWQSPCSSEAGKPEEFKILLCWGGPAVQIIGELDDYNQPCEARLQFQDWFIGWTDHFPEDENADEILLEYCQQFYFGD